MNTIIKFVGENTNKAFLTKINTSVNKHDDIIQQLLDLAHSNNNNLILKAPSKEAFTELNNNYSVMPIEKILSNMTSYFNEENE